MGVEGAEDFVQFQQIEVIMTPLRAEPLLAKLNELRHEAEGDESDVEWLALHHAFCFISYKMGEFQKYLEEVNQDRE